MCLIVNGAIIGTGHGVLQAAECGDAVLERELAETKLALERSREATLRERRSPIRTRRDGYTNYLDWAECYEGLRSTVARVEDLAEHLVRTFTSGVDNTCVRQAMRLAYAIRQRATISVRIYIRG